MDRDDVAQCQIRTLLDAVPAVFGPSGSELDLRWVSPDGAVHASAATILVSNNPSGAHAAPAGRVVADPAATVRGR